jgi:hemerythrin-like domain-containing protein
MKATDALLADHKMIRKILSSFELDNPRFPEILKTMHRVIVGHAWFEDEIFLPALEKEKAFQKALTREIRDEHQDIDNFLKQMKKTAPQNKKKLDLILLQFRVVLSAHFAKEEEALFPLAEKILDGEGLNQLGDEMKRRQAEIRNLVKD